MAKMNYEMQFYSEGFKVSHYYIQRGRPTVLIVQNVVVSVFNDLLKWTQEQNNKQDA